MARSLERAISASDVTPQRRLYRIKVPDSARGSASRIPDEGPLLAGIGKIPPIKGASRTFFSEGLLICV